MEIKVQLSEAFKAMEDVNDSLFEDIKPISVLKEGYLKNCHGKLFCSTDEENWEECSQEEFDELKHGGYVEVECDCEECLHEKEHLGEELNIDLKDEGEVFLAQKIIDMRKEQDEEDTEEIVDLDAADDEEAADVPHVGKIVLMCKTCGTCIYMDKEDIEEDSDNPEVVNKDFKDCPYCHDSTGWEVVGKIAEVEEPVADIITDETKEEEPEKGPEEEKDEEEVELSESISNEVFDTFKQDEFFKQFSDNAVRQFIKVYLDFTGEPESNLSADAVKEFMTEEGLGLFALDNFDKLRFLTFKQVAQLDPKFMEALKKFYPELEEDDDAIDMTFKELTPEELSKTLEDVKKIYLELTEELKKDEKEDDKKDSESEEDNKEEVKEELTTKEESVEIKDLKESRFDSLVNQYLRDIYENVESYKTTDGTVDDENNKLIVEGVIKFKSGKEKNTTFIFEAKTITSKNQIRFVGLNESFSKSKNAFTLRTKLVDDTLFCESLAYDYLPLNAVLTEGKLTEESRVSGKVVNVKEMVFEKRAKIIEAKTKKLVEANKDLTKVEGTVAYVLNKHNADLWAHNSDVEGMREAVLKLLDSEEIKDRETAEEAKKILSKAKPNLFLSTLATYITGLRTAPKKDKKEEKPVEEPAKEEPKEEENKEEK